MPEYYTTQQAARRLGVDNTTLGKTLQSNPQAALAYAINFGVVICGTHIKWPAAYFDRRMVELGLENDESEVS